MQNQEEEKQKIDWDNLKGHFSEDEINQFKEIWAKAINAHSETKDLLDRLNAIPGLNIREILNDPRKSDQLDPPLKTQLANWSFSVAKHMVDNEGNEKNLEPLLSYKSIVMDCFKLAAYLGHPEAHLTIAHIKRYASNYCEEKNLPIGYLTKYPDLFLLRDILNDLTDENYIGNDQYSGEEIISAYKAAQQNSPKPEIPIHLADCLYQTKRNEQKSNFEEPKALFLKSINVHNLNPLCSIVAKIRLGEIAIIERDFDKAREYHESAYHLGKTTLEPIQFLNLIKIIAGTYYNQNMDNLHDSPFYWYRRALLHLSCEKLPQSNVVDKLKELLEAPTITIESGMLKIQEQISLDGIPDRHDDIDGKIDGYHILMYQQAYDFIDSDKIPLLLEDDLLTEEKRLKILEIWLMNHTWPLEQRDRLNKFYFDNLQAAADKGDKKTAKGFLDKLMETPDSKFFLQGLDTFHSLLMEKAKTRAKKIASHLGKLLSDDETVPITLKDPDIIELLIKIFEIKNNNPQPQTLENIASFIDWFFVTLLTVLPNTKSFLENEKKEKGIEGFYAKEQFLDFQKSGEWPTGIVKELKGFYLACSSQDENDKALVDQLFGALNIKNTELTKTPSTSSLFFSPVPSSTATGANPPPTENKKPEDGESETENPLNDPIV